MAVESKLPWVTLSVIFVETNPALRVYFQGKIKMGKQFRRTAQVYLENFERLPEKEIAQIAGVSRQRINQLQHYFGVSQIRFRSNEVKLKRICPQCNGRKSVMGRICRFCQRSRKVALICEWCGKPFERSVYKVRNKHNYCNKRCFGAWLGAFHGFGSRKRKKNEDN